LQKYNNKEAFAILSAINVAINLEGRRNVYLREKGPIEEG
jgi:hypothetical protein